MAVIWMDGFDYYRAFTHILDIYDEAPNLGFTDSVTPGRLGGKAVQSVTNGGFRKWLSSAIGPTVGIGCAFQWNGGAQGVIMSLWDGTTTQIDLREDPTTRKLYVTRNGTTIATGTKVLLLNVWYQVEMKVFLDSSSGTVEVRLNGVTEMTFTGNTKATANATVSRVAWGYNGAGGGSHIIDDVFVWDTSGSINTDWLGDNRVILLAPTGAGNTTQWTPSTGSNWQNVDETDPNDDTDYNSDANPGDKDTYQMADLSVSAGTVAAVQSILRLRKDDAGVRTARRVIRSGSTDYEGADIGVLDSYTYTREILETDPHTSARWTVSNVNAMEHGQKLQA